MLHKCQMDIKVHLPPDFANQFITCSKIIPTHSGLFQDPCQTKSLYVYLRNLCILLKFSCTTSTDVTKVLQCSFQSILYIISSSYYEVA